MGNSDSKPRFRGSVLALIDRPVPAEETAFWEGLWSLPSTAQVLPRACVQTRPAPARPDMRCALIACGTQDVFSMVAPTDIRNLRERQPGNLRSLIEQAIMQLQHLIESPKPEFYAQAINCVRLKAACRIACNTSAGGRLTLLRARRSACSRASCRSCLSMTMTASSCPCSGTPCGRMSSAASHLLAVQAEQGMLRLQRPRRRRRWRRRPKQRPRRRKPKPLPHQPRPQPHCNHGTPASAAPGCALAVADASRRAAPLPGRWRSGCCTPCSPSSSCPASP